MSNPFWKKNRNDTALQLQWLRRIAQPRPFILQEVETRMIARLRIMRPVEGGVLHQGWLHPESLTQFQNAFEGRPCSVRAPAVWDFPRPLASSGKSGWFQSLLMPKSRVALAPAIRWTSAQDAPVEPESLAMVWSPLWLHAQADPVAQVQQWNGWLKPEGALFLTAFGPDTAQELAPFASALGVSLPDYPDMHDLGDLLAAQGFADPVMETERLTLTYTTPQSLLNDWRALNGNSLVDRPAGLTGKTAYANALAVLADGPRTSDGRLTLTLELIYGHAWKVKRMPRQQVSTVSISEIGGRKEGKTEKT